MVWWREGDGIKEGEQEGFRAWRAMIRRNWGWKVEKNEGERT